jgi:hypothetical protein
LFNAHRLHLVHEVRAEDLIPIPQQVPRHGVPGKGFAHLLCRPLSRWMGSHREVHDAPAFMRQNQKHVQDLEPDRRYGEKVH